MSGDGYDAEGSPHTVHEAFAGLGLERAVEVGRVGGWRWLTACWQFLKNVWNNSQNGPVNK